MTSKPNPKTKIPASAPAELKAKKNHSPRPRKRVSRQRAPSRSFSAEEKAQAVLASWTERLNQSEICRQLEINYVTFRSWQNRAMEGMLQALEDHARLTEGAALSPRLRKLIERQRAASPNPRLEQRLQSLQQEKDKDPSNC